MRRNTTLKYHSKEDRFFLHCPLYVKHMEQYNKTPWPHRLSTASVTEDKVWGGYSTKHIWIKVNTAED